MYTYVCSRAEIQAENQKNSHSFAERTLGWFCVATERIFGLGGPWWRGEVPFTESCWLSDGSHILIQL